jgi:hypothetical protein
MIPTVFVPSHGGTIPGRTGAATAPGDRWIRSTRFTVTPSITTTDTAATVTATLDDQPFTFTNGIGTAISADGTHTLIVRLTNGDGTASEHSVVFTYDHTAPVTKSNAPSTIQVAPLTIVLSATDAVSGVASTHYSLDGATFKTYTSAGVPVRTWKTHTLAYYSVDAAGNTEAKHTVTFAMRQPTTLSIYAPSTGKRKHAFTLSGYLSPGTTKDKITLKYQRPGSYTVKTGSRGKWTYKYTPTLKGTYHFKVSYAGSTTRYKSGSTTKAVKVS